MVFCLQILILTCVVLILVSWRSYCTSFDTTSSLTGVVSSAIPRIEPVRPVVPLTQPHQHTYCAHGGGRVSPNKGQAIYLNNGVEWEHSFMQHLLGEENSKLWRHFIHPKSGGTNNFVFCA